MKKRVISILLSTALAATVLVGCGNNSAVTSNDTAAETANSSEAATDAASDTASGSSSETTTDSSSETSSDTSTEGSTLPSSFEEFVDSLTVGQSYAYAPICDGEDALLVTGYTFDDQEGHQATYTATIYIMGASGNVEKVTTITTNGTAYPLAVSKDNNLILSRRRSVQEAHVDKATGKYVITRESDIEVGEEDLYHNYTKTDGKTDISTDSSLHDELYDLYTESEILSFSAAGVSPDGAPRFAKAVYAESRGDDTAITGYYAFKDETSGFTQTTDGISGVPFEYEVNGTEITFHFGSADDTTKATFSAEYPSSPTLTFEGDDQSEAYKSTLTCLSNTDPESFDAATYYDNDDSLLMQVSSFDDTSFTGDLYHEERISADAVEKAKEGDYLYSDEGTQFIAVPFEEANKQLEYGKDEEFKKDVVGTTRFDKFIVKSSDDNFYYALEKREYDAKYDVVALMTSETLKKGLEKNVTFPIREDSEIYLIKYISNDKGDSFKDVYVIGREFKADNYPAWTDGAQEYFLSTAMLLAVSVIDGEIAGASQVYVP